MTNLKDRLIEANKSDKLLEFIGEIYYEDFKNENSLPCFLAELNNIGKINLIGLLKNLKNTGGNNSFFSILRVFSETLPDIDTPVKDVANCVKHLTREAGQDMAASMLLSPFKEFCKKDSDRAKALFDITLADIDDHFEHLSTAIEAGASNDSDRAKALFDITLADIDDHFEHLSTAMRVIEATYVNLLLSCLLKNELIKQRTIFALGRINYQEKILLESVAVAIKESCSSSPTDVILATSLQAEFAIVSLSDNLESFFLNFLSSYSKHLGDRYIHTASQILFYEKEKVSRIVESKLLDICCHTKPENTDTIRNINYALEWILKRKDFDDCISFLERFFELSQYQLSVKHFDSFVRELHNHRDTYLSSLLTRWLLSKKVALGKYCSDLLQDTDKGISIGFNRACFPSKSKGVHLFLAKKACGWFFNQPKTAMSLIESLIPNAPEDELLDIQQIVLQPLCISYPGSIRQRMEELQSSKQKRMAEVASHVLSDYMKYQASVKAALKVNELMPSEQDRHTYWRHHNKLMDESMKQARSKSFFASLCAGNESILLYGNKHIYYSQHGDHKTRQEMPLHEISTSFEFASMHTLDPHSLENMIFQFKAEGCS